jgi:hypothetical protein
MNAETERIKRKSNTREHSCDCKTCRKMCRVSPCLGTPEDILLLMNNGHTDKLSPTTFGTGKLLGVLPVIEMIQPRYEVDKLGCAFLSPDDLCTLHSAGLKPTEGKLATHLTVARELTKEEIKSQLTMVVAERWLTVKNISTINTIVHGYVKYFTRQPKDTDRIFYLPAAVGQ